MERVEDRPRELLWEQREKVPRVKWVFQGGNLVSRYDDEKEEGAEQ